MSSNGEQFVESNGQANLAGLHQSLMFLDTSNIMVDETFNVRPYTSSRGMSERDVEELDRLVASIEVNGQEQPVIVQFSEDNGYKLIAGHRRLKAIEHINLGRSLDDRLLVQAVVSTADNPLRVAFDENDKRAAMSPMDKALNFKSIRERNKWNGAKGDKKVADYFGVNVATVVQYKKLEKLNEDIQDKIHSGVLTMDAALIVAKANPEDQKDLVIAAERLEQQKFEEEGEAEAENAVSTGRNKKKRQAKGGKKGISASSVKKAAREKGVKISRNRSTILEWVEGENGPGYADHVTAFLTYFLKWADGDGTDRTLTQKFKDAIGKDGLNSQKEVKKSISFTAKPKK